MHASLALAFTIIGTSALTALAALALFALALHQRTNRTPLLDPAEMEDTVFVFDNETLVDSSDAGAALLRALGGKQDGHGTGDCAPARGPLQALLAFLQPRFPDLQAQLGTLAEAGHLTLTAQDGSGLILRARWRDGMAQLVLQDPAAEGACVAMDRLSFTALEDELRMLRDCVSRAPVLIWRTDRDGRVIWANGAYLQAAAHSPAGTSQLGWPLPAILDSAAATGRVALLSQPGGGQNWYDHIVQSCRSGDLHFATPVPEPETAEAARREVMHSLTRTFATLPIGLAVFDTARRLQVFNPALVDLTGLEPQFLTARPGFDQFMHRLRERRMLPEQRDFRSWRSALLEIERAADSGSYLEEWLLPNGQTYQVSGRPQPDGAIAFFFEDITSEIALARSFRAEIETAQSVIDSLPEAMGVFSRQGVLVLANAAYQRLWQTEPCGIVGQIGLPEAMSRWRSGSQPSPAWDALYRFVHEPAEFAADAGTETVGAAPSQDWTVMLRTGKVLHLRAERLPEMRTLVRFGTAQPGVPATTQHRDRRAHDRILSTALVQARDGAQAPFPDWDAGTQGAPISASTLPPLQNPAHSQPGRDTPLPRPDPQTADRALRVRHRSSRAIGDTS